MRRPHIFISSRLTLGPLRAQIRALLECSGFSAEIYEADSTPSTEPATYLRDIGNADFVIFVLDQTYGKPRPSTGRSGVHEEWEIVKSKGTANHVYLQRASTASTVDEEQETFIRSELEEREISYFYYESAPELLQQIQKSIVKMALDISHSPDFRAGVPQRVLAGEVAKRDHDTFFLWDRALTQVDTIENEGNYLTDGWVFICDSFPHFNPERLGPFLDMKIQELFGDVLHAMLAVSGHEEIHVVGDSGDGPTINLPYKPITLSRLKVVPPIPGDYYAKRVQLKKKIFEKWDLVRELVLCRYSRYSHIHE